MFGADAALLDGDDPPEDGGGFFKMAFIGKSAGLDVLFAGPRDWVLVRCSVHEWRTLAARAWEAMIMPKTRTGRGENKKPAAKDRGLMVSGHRQLRRGFVTPDRVFP